MRPPNLPMRWASSGDKVISSASEVPNLSLTKARLFSGLASAKLIALRGLVGRADRAVCQRRLTGQEHSSDAHLESAPLRHSSSRKQPGRAQPANSSFSPPRSRAPRLRPSHFVLHQTRAPFSEHIPQFRIPRRLHVEIVQHQNWKRCNEVVLGVQISRSLAVFRRRRFEIIDHLAGHVGREVHRRQLFAPKAQFRHGSIPCDAIEAPIVPATPADQLRPLALGSLGRLLFLVRPDLPSASIAIGSRDFFEGRADDLENLLELLIDWSREAGYKFPVVLVTGRQSMRNMLTLLPDKTQTCQVYQAVERGQEGEDGPVACDTRQRSAKYRPAASVRVFSPV